MWNLWLIHISPYLNPCRVDIYTHAVQWVVLGSLKWYWRIKRVGNKCPPYSCYLNPCRVDIYAHAVQWVGFRQPEMDGDKTRGQQVPTLPLFQEYFNFTVI